MIGFGLSEKPTREHAHSLDGHIANLTALLRQLGPAARHAGLPRLGRSDRPRLRVQQSSARPSAGADEHLGLAAASGRVPHTHLSLAHDARPAGRPVLLGRHNALAGRGIYLSVVDRQRFASRAQAAYEAVLPDPASRLLTWVWPRWIPLDATARALPRFVWLEQQLRACRLPALLVWGREDDVFDAGDLRHPFQALCRTPRAPTW